MLMEKKWFEWEREATVHPILICLESWMEPTRAYCGRPWPTSYLHYTGDIIMWVNPLDELKEYGAYLFEKFSRKTEREKLETDIKTIAKKLDSIFEKFEKTNLAKLNECELLDYYLLVKNGFVEWFVPGALVEPIGIEGERRIRALLDKKGVKKGEIDSTVSILTTTPHKTFSKRELEELLSIAINAYKGASIDALLERHVELYFWIHNNYFTTEALGKDFFKNQLITLLSKNGNPASYLTKLESEFKSVLDKKQSLIAELKLSNEEKELIEFLELFAWYNDYRKEYVMKILHYLDAVLSEIARRKGLSLKQMKYSMAHEVESVLNGTFDTPLLEKRMKEFVAVWDPQGNKFETFTADAQSAWKRIDPHITHKQEQVEITGLPASRGIVRGRAYVTMNAQDSKNMQSGDILITSMTTPDFVTGMKKAVAVVTNEGGILCHAAVVSREFGIPCVVGTQVATRALKTGDYIEVNGDQGIVKKL